MTTAPATQTPARVAPTAAFAAEWSKLFSLRTTRRTLVASLVLAVAMAALLCLAIEATTGKPLDRTSTVDVVGASMLAVDATALLILVMASGLVGSEYANGMIRTTLTAVPGRTRLLLSRAAVLAVVGYAIGVLSALLAFATGQAILVGLGLPTASLLDPQILRLLLGVAVEVPVYGLFGMAFAFVFRATGGGIVCALVVVFLPTVLDWLRDYLPDGLIAYMPNPAIHDIAGLTLPTDPYYAGAGAAALTLLVWVAAALALADRLLAARDA